MNEKDVSYQKIPNQDPSTSGSTQNLSLESTPLDVKIVQLEISQSALKEKVDSAAVSRKWLLGTIITISGIIIGLVFSVVTFIDNSINSYKDLQDNYYQALMENSSLLNKTQTCLSFSKLYSQFKDCVVNEI